MNWYGRTEVSDCRDAEYSIAYDTNWRLATDKEIKSLYGRV